MVLETGGAYLPANANTNAPTEVWAKVVVVDQVVWAQLWYQEVGQKPVMAREDRLGSFSLITGEPAR